MKVIIAGGRDFKDYEQLEEVCDDLLEDISNLEIVSGGQVTINPITGERYGADYLGEKYAKKRGIPIKKFPANWNLHGRKAGPVRNKQMAEYADTLIAFWDGKSKGTKNMIDTAIYLKLKVYTISY